jgi:arachidonate 15-lipoxygenase
MTAFLPQQDPDGNQRAKDLETRRNEYHYSYTHVSPLALVDRLPIHDQFSREWLKVVSHTVFYGLANYAEVAGALPLPFLHSQRHALIIRLIELGRGSVRWLRWLLGRSLRKQWQEGGLPDRPDGLEAYARIFRAIGLPPIHREYFRDDVFAEMRVAGPNPVMLQRVSKLDDRFPVTEPIFQSFLPGDSLAAAAGEGRLYLTDFQMVETMENGIFPSVQKYIYAPLALFAVGKTSRRLVPIAIQCKQRPGPDNPIFTPNDGYNWLIAKTIVGIADGNLHEAVTHLARTHLLMEPFVLATIRQLASNHPLFVLLIPHFEGTMAINHAAWRFLIAEKGPIDKMFGGTIQSTRALAASGVQSHMFRESMLPLALKARGVDDLQALPHYPYRDDALLLWNAIRQWVAEYVGLHYLNESDVAQDHELAAWSAEITSTEGGRLKGIGQDGKIHTREDLIDTVTLVIYTCSVQHAAVNFPQYDLMSYAPAMPLASYRPAPTSKQGGTAADYLAMLPPLKMAELQMELAYLLGSVYYTTLGDYRPGHFQDTRTQAPLAAFRQQLTEIGKNIRTRNQSRRPYEYLIPSRIPQSINI